MNQIDYLYKQYSENGNAIEVDFRSLVPAIVTPERYTHLIHPYPAKLLVNIPYYILNSGRYCPKGGLVLDPFCGAGTVMLEALLNGCNSIGGQPDNGLPAER